MTPRRSFLTIGSLALALAGCAHGDMFAPAGPAARSIGWLGGSVLVALSVVALVVLALLLTASVRSPGSLADHEPIHAPENLRWITIGGFCIPVVVLGIIFAATLHTSNRFPLHDGEHYKSDIRIVGRQWWWEVDYLNASPDRMVVTANEIHIPINWEVELELESRDVIHSFWVPALHGKVDLVPGHPNHIRLFADQPGRYEGQCAEYCGAQHTLMKFAVIAEPLDSYEAWLAHEGAPAGPPVDDEARRGEALFANKACGLCHRIRGTSSLATVGPDLTHLASRRTIAAGSFPNSRAWLEAWVTHAQALKPEAQMPDLTQFEGDDLQALAHYLEGLK